MKIEKREWALAIVFGIIGIIVSSRFVILWLNGLNPFYGFLVYYAIILTALFVLSKLGLVLFNIKIDKFSQLIGTILIIFSFFLLFNWESGFVSFVTTGSVSTVPPIYLGTEDGLTFYFFNTVMGINDMFLNRILTYVITPFILSLFGGLLLENKPRISP